jgi:hypothetical protein
MKRSDRALSETMAHLLIAMLAIAAVLILTASLTGVLTNLLQKSALFSVEARPYETSNGFDIISLYHQQGDPVNLNGTEQYDGISTVSITLNTPAGQQVPVRNSGAIRHSAWTPGNYLYIYRDGGGTYRFTDIAPGAGVVTSNLDTGDYTVIIMDDKVSVLLHSLPVTIPSS